MALVQWKQIAGDLTGSRALTGSLYVSGGIDVSGSLTVNGIDIVDASIFRRTGSYYSTTNDLKITGSLQLSLDGVQDYFSIEVGGEEKFKVNTEGVVELDPFDTAPTAVTGGLFYSGSDEYYLGFRN